LYIDEKSTPIGASGQITVNKEGLAEARELGEKFLDALGLDRQCVILTGVPNSIVDSPAIAGTLAALLKTRSILPATDGLATLDSVHLNFASAERWSGLFVHAMTPVLQKCLTLDTASQAATGGGPAGRAVSGKVGMIGSVQALQ
jgi:hypothetical protein